MLKSKQKLYLNYINQLLTGICFVACLFTTFKTVRMKISNPNIKGPILLIEDDTVDQMMLKKALKEIEFPNELLIKSNGEEALEYLQSSQRKPFIIISDIQVPRMNGLELLAEMSKNPEIRKKNIPFVFLSSSATDDDILAAMEYGAHYFEKKNDYRSYVHMIYIIIEYWSSFRMPSTDLYNSVHGYITADM